MFEMDKKKLVAFVVIIGVIFCSCRHLWERCVDILLDPRKTEQEFGEPRTSFYSCPYSDREPRIPILYPVEMVKNDELGWSLRTIGLNGVIGDIHFIDLMYGDSNRIFVHSLRASYRINKTFFDDPERWIIINLKDKSYSEYLMIDDFKQLVGEEVVGKLISPDIYYTMFCGSADSLPWICKK